MRLRGKGATGGLAVGGFIWRRSEAGPFQFPFVVAVVDQLMTLDGREKP